MDIEILIHPKVIYNNIIVGHSEIVKRSITNIFIKTENMIEFGKKFNMEEYIGVMPFSMEISEDCFVYECSVDNIEK